MTREDTVFLFNCIRRLIEGDDIDTDKVIEVMENDGFLINSDMEVEEG